MLDTLSPEILATILSALPPLDARWATVARLNQYIGAVAARTRVLTPELIAQHSETAVDHYAAKHGLEWFRAARYHLPLRHFRELEPRIGIDEFVNIMMDHPRLLPAVWHSENINDWLGENMRLSLAADMISKWISGNQPQSNPFDLANMAPPGYMRMGLFNMINEIDPTALISAMFAIVVVDARRSHQNAIITSELITIIMNYSLIIGSAAAVLLIKAFVTLSKNGQLQGWINRVLDKFEPDRTAHEYSFPQYDTSWIYSDDVNQIRLILHGRGARELYESVDETMFITSISNIIEAFVP